MHALPINQCANQPHHLRPGSLPNLVLNTILSAMECPAGLPADILYLQNTLKKGDVLLDVGTTAERWMFRLLSAVGKNGKVVLFGHKCRLGARLRVQHWLFPIKKIEQHALHQLQLPPGTVLHFNTGQPVGNQNQVAGRLTLDQFCQRHAVRPGVIRLGTDAEALGLLKGCAWLIGKYRPAFVVQYQLQADSRPFAQMLQWMTMMGYDGYFLLDTLKIPIANFDPRLYQNPSNNFYCDQFVFE